MPSGPWPHSGFLFSFGTHNTLLLTYVTLFISHGNSLNAPYLSFISDVSGVKEKSNDLLSFKEQFNPGELTCSPYPTPPCLGIQSEQHWQMGPSH